MSLDCVQIPVSLGFEFLESVLSDLTAAIVFSALGLAFARPIAAVLRRRLYHDYLLPPESIPHIEIIDNTPATGSNVRMLEIQNNGNIALRDFRLYACCFSFGPQTVLQIEPIAFDFKVFLMDSERGGLASAHVPFDSLVFDCEDSWEKRFFIEMSDAEGHIFRRTHYVTNEGEISPQGLRLVKRRLPQRCIKRVGEKRVERFRDKYSLDMVSG